MQMSLDGCFVSGRNAATWKLLSSNPDMPVTMPLFSAAEFDHNFVVCSFSMNWGLHKTSNIIFFKIVVFSSNMPFSKTDFQP